MNIFSGSLKIILLTAVIVSLSSCLFNEEPDPFSGVIYIKNTNPDTRFIVNIYNYGYGYNNLIFKDEKINAGTAKAFDISKYNTGNYRVSYRADGSTDEKHRDLYIDSSSLNYNMINGNRYIVGLIIN